MSVRTRIAPSPTGLLHVGNARTALFNWLFAKQSGGVFIVRVEDTDIERSRTEFETDALENFQWLGLDWEEGPILAAGSRQHVLGEKELLERKTLNTIPDTSYQIPATSDEVGDYGPYRQSRRGEIYKKYLEELYEEGHLYHCFCTREELEAMRQSQLARGEAPRYVGRCREQTPQETKELGSRGVPSVLRFRVSSQKVVVHDMVRGAVEFDTALMGDTVVAKDFTHPVFHFAVVVDDFTMEISHVIRGEDHLSNTPLHMLLQEALGFNTPNYAHIPLLLGSDRTKLSKRHGATAVTEYRKAGYLPEAMVNFLALLGWHPKNDREVFSKEELTRQFSLQDVQKSAAIFNVEKLRWLNSEYIKNLDSQKLVERTLAFNPKRTAGIAQHIIEGAIDTMRTRAKTIRDIVEYVEDLSIEPRYPKKLLYWKNMGDDEVVTILKKLIEALGSIPENEFTKENMEKMLMPKAAEWGSGDRGRVLWPLRVALSGKEKSAGPFELARDLGKKNTIKRLEDALRVFVPSLFQ